MFELLNDIDSSIIYILIIILILIVIAIFYLVYTQHREMVKMLAKNNEKVIKSDKENINIENTMANIELPIMKENNDLEIVKEKVILPKIETDIPDKFDYTQALWQKDEIDLEKLSQELETRDSSKNRVATYEEEQEEQAIISYDELKRKTLQEEKIELPVKKKIVEEQDFKTYEHEEIFLNELKKLRNVLK